MGLFYSAHCDPSHRMCSTFGILGTPISSGNRGVLALGASLLNLCARGGDGGEVFLMLGHHKSESVRFRVAGKIHSIPVVNCRLSPRARLYEHLGWIVLASLLYRLIPVKSLRSALSRFTPWISAMEKADVIGDVRGGDSFSDIYGMGRFLHGFLMAWTVVLVKGSIVQFPQTLGPYRRRIARMLAAYLLKRSSVIMARDRDSQMLAQELVKHKKEVWLCPDVAFSLEAVRPNHIELDPPLNGSEIPLRIIGLNINGLMFNGGYTRENMFGLKMKYPDMVLALIKVLLQEHPGGLWLIPHVYGPSNSVESDNEACRKVRLALPEGLQRRVAIVAGEYDCHEIKWLIGRCDFFIGSRMHACIAALSQGVPCVGIAYSRKFAGVFDSVGMSAWVVDGRETDTEQAVARVLELYRKRDRVREELAQNAQRAQVELRNFFISFRRGNLHGA